ncbi:MAG: 50S ribosomal protein L5 [Gammaproteobacteria bacterium]|nr:50S ribosomal protein L5 [Gammaproteobacteria bacterium]
MSEVVAGKEAGKDPGKEAGKPKQSDRPAGKHAEKQPGKAAGKQAGKPDKQADGDKQAAAHGHRPADERPSGPPRLQQYYRQQVVPKLRSELKIANVMEVPRISKITINMGVGEAVADKKVMDAAIADLTSITGQKPLVTKSRKAIASFKIRAGLNVGAKVTLRGSRMYEFLDRLINIAMPRIRDFRGVSPRAFDGRGNYSLGVKEQIIFPEIQYDQIDQVRGMDITITTTAMDDRKGRALLEAFNFPFRK